MKDKLTIVIPTHNRHNYLARLIKYFEGIDIDIYIADSSKKKYQEELYPNIKYYHYPDTNLMCKLNDIVKKISSKYMVFCADDDFLIKDCLYKYVKFLDNNEDYSCIQGKYLLFNQNNNLIKYTHGYHQNKTLSSVKMSERLNDLMSDYMPLFYGIHRTEIIQKAYSDMYNNDLSNPILVELLVALYPIIMGKYKVLDTFYYIRDRSSVSTDVDRTGYEQMINNPKYKKQLNIFYTLVKNYIYNVSQSKQIDEKAFFDSLNTFVEKINFKPATETIEDFINLSKDRRETNIKNKTYCLNALKNIYGDINILKEVENILLAHKIDLEEISEETKTKLFIAKNISNIYSQIEILRNILKNKKVLIYGYGTLGRIISKTLVESEIMFIDKGTKKMYNKDGFQIYPLESFDNLTYDTFIISVLGREKEILMTIKERFNIDENSIITFE